MSQRHSSEQGGFSHWLVRILTRLLLLLLVFVAGAVTMHIGMHGGDAEHIQALQGQVAALQAELRQVHSDTAADQSRSAMESGTVRALQEKNVELQHTLGQLQSQLAFYEQLIPPGPAGSVTIRAFEVVPEGDVLAYKVLLTRNALPGATQFQGQLKFVAHGTQEGKPAKIDLVSPSDPAGGGGSAAQADPSPLALQFEQFQRSTGVLRIPPGFEPRSVQLEVLEGDTVRAAQEATVSANGKQP